MEQRKSYPLFILCTSFLLGSCDEQFPIHADPTRLFASEMSALSRLDSYETLGNTMSAYFTVTNIFDETLEGVADIKGTITVSSVRNPHIQRTIAFSIDDLQEGAQYYNSNTKILKLDPQQSLQFTVSWDFLLDDRGVDPRGELFRFVGDPTCEYRCLGLPEELMLSGEVFLYAERAPVLTVGIVSVCYLWGDFNHEEYETCPEIRENIACADSTLYLPFCNPFGGVN